MTRFERQNELRIGCRVRIKKSIDKFAYGANYEMLQSQRTGEIGTVKGIGEEVVLAEFPSHSCPFNYAKNELEIV